MENWNELVTSHGNYQDLCNAAIQGNDEQLRLHLRGGIDPNFQPQDTNALFKAIRAGQLTSVKVLIQSGADPCIKEVSTGMTAQEVARHEGQNEIEDYITMMIRYM